MVKKAIVTAMAVISLFTLMGCNNRAEVDTLSPAQAAELKPMPQSWRGVLPCADCEGIETSLFLEKDGTWVMNERYLGAREEPSSFASYGTWARTADKLVLTDSKGEKSYYRAKAMRWRCSIVKAIRLNRSSTIRWKRHNPVYL